MEVHHARTMRLSRLLRNPPLDTDDDILYAAESLIGRAMRREPALRFIALDERQRASRRLLGLYGQPEMDDQLADGVARWVDGCADVVAIDRLIAVWQRRGSDQFDDAELQWMRAVGRALHERGYPVRAWLLSHSRGLRWVAVDDLLPPRETFHRDVP